MKKKTMKPIIRDSMKKNVTMSHLECHIMKPNNVLM